MTSGDGLQLPNFIEYTESYEMEFNFFTDINENVS